MTGDLKLAYAQFLELETFARFGTRLDEHTLKILAHGKRIRNCLVQGESEALSLAEQITLLLALSKGLLDDVPQDKIKGARAALCAAVSYLPSDLKTALFSDKKLNDATCKTILDNARAALTPFSNMPEKEKAA